MNGLPRLPSREADQWPMEHVQQPAMPVLHGQADSAHRQAADTDQRRNHCTAACGFSGCGRLGTRGSADSQDGEGDALHSSMRLRERDCKDFVAKGNHE